VTKQLLREAKEAGIPAVWLQPGSFDREVLEYAQANFKAAIGGNGGGGSEGWCVLVDGEEGLRLAEREWSRLWSWSIVSTCLHITTIYLGRNFYNT
jgi:hypothetical protein